MPTPQVFVFTLKVKFHPKGKKGLNIYIYQNLLLNTNNNFIDHKLPSV